MASSLKVLEILEASRLEASEARAIAHAIEEAERGTAQDIKGVLEEHFQKIKGVLEEQSIHTDLKIDGLRTELKGEIKTFRQEVRADQSELESRLTNRFSAFGITMSGTILAGTYFMLTHFRP